MIGDYRRYDRNKLYPLSAKNHKKQTFLLHNGGIRNKYRNFW